ncbi:MAG: hypothetical protein IT340_19525 [Chloroflexi bacterium]|nr:hypothetical protein [Chloroflexota bacterium]
MPTALVRRVLSGLTIGLALVLGVALLPAGRASAALPAGQWTLGPDLARGRDDHTVTLLANGKVLVVGGVDDSILATAEIYDPATNAWSPTGSMTTVREQHTATLLANGKVLVAGGHGPDRATLASAELYDPATGAWSATGSLSKPSDNHSSTRLQDGRVLLLSWDSGAASIYSPTSGAWLDVSAPTGGIESVIALLLQDGRVFLVQQGNTSDIYDPVTDTWMTTAERSARYRSGPSATLLSDGKVLVAGGDDGDTTLATAEIYDPVMDTWVDTGAMATPRESHTAVRLADGSVLVLGGNANSAALPERFEPATGAWSPTGALSTPSYFMTATLLPSGRILTTGAGPYSKTVQIYDPNGTGGPPAPIPPLPTPVASSEWAASGNPPSGHASVFTLTRLPSGKVLLAGGQRFLADGFGVSIATADLYDPASGAWAATSPMGEARESHAAVLLPNGKVLVAGGDGPNSTGDCCYAMATAELYDPATGAWSATGAMTRERDSLTGVLLGNGKVLVVEDGRQSTEVYDPASGTWAATGSLTTSLYDVTATLLTSGKVLVVGFEFVTTSMRIRAEVYDPASGVWAPTGNPATERAGSQTTRLANGKVLLSGGRSSTGAGATLASAELYDPATGVWSPTGSMSAARRNHGAVLLGSGKVLVAGGTGPVSAGCCETHAGAEIYDPATGAWASAGTMPRRSSGQLGLLLADGRALITSGFRTALYTPAGSPNQPTPVGSFALGQSAQGTIGAGAAQSWGVALTAGQKVRFILTGAAETLQLLGPDGQVVAAGAERRGGMPQAAATVQLNASVAVSGEHRLVVRDTDNASGAYQVQSLNLPPTIGELTWYFAEGYTGPGFDEYLTIQNPNAGAADLKITYFLTGAAPVEKLITVAANSRYTVTVHEAKEGVGRNQAVSAKVESTNGVGIVVERPMYFTYSGGVDGGHNVMGVTTPRLAWLFAEGYTGVGFDEYLTILNPNSTATVTEITYFLAQGAPVVKTITVPANSRYTVTVHDKKEGVGRDQAVSARVTTTNPGGIVVERPMYFTYGGSLGGVTGGHNVMGTTGPRPIWYFPEGNTNNGYDQYLTLMNTNAQASQVRLTYYVVGEAVPRTKAITVPANSRYTVSVHDDAEGVGRGKRLGMKVETTNGVDLVVERPLYFRYSPTVNGGHNIMGASSAAKTWLFAEGYTGAGFDEELVVLNPSAAPVTVTITYYSGGGTAPVEKQLTVDPYSRFAVQVHGATLGVGRDKAVSAKVETTAATGIVVERPMYFAYSAKVNGGHTVMGYTP